MTTVRLGVVVEGHGEAQAVPVLLRRIASELDPGTVLDIPQPLRVAKDRLLRREGELTRTIDLLRRKVGPSGGLVVTFDADDDCPAVLGPRARTMVSATGLDVPFSIIIPRQEFEAWLVAGAEGLRGRRGLPADLVAPDDPEALRDGKGWLGARMPRWYSPTVDQAALASAFDMERARQRSPSFARCWREVERLVRALRGATPPPPA